MLRLRLLFVLGVVVACDSANLTTTPGPAVTGGTSGTPPPTKEEDAGDTEPPPDPSEWGDPKTVRRPGKLRFEQLNVRRFFDTICDSGEGACPTDFEEVLTQDEFDRRAAQLADGFAKIQPDIITLAEIEKQSCLDAVQKALKDRGFDYPIAHVAETGGRGSIDVAVLARGTLDSIKTHRREDPLPTGGQFTREFPEVHLTLGKSKVVVFAAHFRSKSAPDQPERRLGEAQRAQSLMLAAAEADPDALVLMGGDLNDTPGSPPLEALEAGGKLLRVASDIDAQGTYKYSGGDQAIDHLFVTGNHKSAYIAKSALVVRDSATARGFAGSDHATLWADFNLPK